MNNYFLMGLKALLLILVTTISLFAEPQSDRSIISKDHINHYQLSNSEWLIRFDNQLNESDKDRILSSLSFVQSSVHYPSPEVSIVKVAHGLTEAQMQLAFESEASILFASRGLIYGGEERDFSLDRVFVQLKNSGQLSSLQQQASAVGAEIIGESFMADLYELRLDKYSTLDPIAFSNQLNSSSSFAWAEPDLMLFLEKLSIPNDPDLNDQWSLNNTGSANQYNGTSGEDMDVFNAWNFSTGSSSIKVAILDEGVDLNHPDLVANLLPGFDGHGITAGGAINSDAHGTACAGIVAGVANNNIGISGIAYDSKIIPIRIAYSDANGDWVTSNSILGACITWAWQTAGADVLSNSWSGGGQSLLVSTTVNDAVSYGRGGLGAVFLASRGNKDNTIARYPAGYSGAISVAATSMCGERTNPNSCDGETWWGSSYGSDLSISAPGVKIYTTDISGANGYSPGDYHATFNGTSSACPNAAGVMALILSTNPALTETEARDIIESTCEKVGGYNYVTTSGFSNGTRCDDLGYGRVNAFAAVQAAYAAAGCAISSFPFTENFESNSSTLNCWTNEYVVGTGDWTFNTGSSGGSITAANSGSSNARFISSNASNSPITKLVSPVFDISGLTAPRLEFYFGQEDWSGDQNELKVYYRPSASVNWIPLSHYTSDVSTWTIERLALPNASSTYQIAFEGINNWGRANVVDDVTIEQTPTCGIPPNVYTSFVSPSTAIVHWSPASDAMNYTVEYGPAGFTQGNGNSIITNDTSVFLQGLADNSTYDFYVQSNCGLGSTSNLSIRTFTTPCTTVYTAPYLEDFENTTAGDFHKLGNCWVQTSPSQTNPRWETEDASGVNENSLWTGPFYDHTNFGIAGGKYVYLETSSPISGIPAVLEGPLIDLSGLSAPLLSFYYHMYGADMGILEVEISDDGGQSWNHVWSLSGQQQLAGNDPWTQVGIPLPYTGNIQIRFIGTQGTDFRSDMSIDDISIYEGCVAPSSLAISSSDNLGNATINWSSQESAWEVEYGPAGFVQGTGTLTAVTDTFIDISGLTASTDYEAYVRTNCGSQNSYWVGPLTFTTPCATASMPYLRDFDGTNWPPDCWTLGGSRAVVQNSNDYLEASFWNWNGGQATASTEAISINSIAMVKFKWAHKYHSTYPNDQMMLLVRLSNSTQWDTLVNFIGPSFTSPNANNAAPPVDSDFIEEILFLDPTIFTGQDVVFQFVFNSGYGPDVYVDDFRVEEAPFCSAPTTLFVDSISSSSARILWSDTSSAAPQWTLEYGPAGFTQGTGTIVTSTDTSAILSSLTPSSNYDVYVRSDCSSSISYWTGPLNFSTLCPPTSIPYLRDFDGANWPPTCWTFDGTQTVVQNSSDYLEASFWDWQRGEVALASTEPIFISTNARVYFRWAHLYHSTYPADQMILRVRSTSSTQWDTLADFMGPSFSSPNATNSAPPSDADFVQEAFDIDPSFTGQDLVFQFVFNSDYGPDIYIDDFKVEELPVCPVPLGVVANNIGVNDAEISWVAVPNTWQGFIEYGPAGFTQGSGTIFSQNVVNNPSITISGLNPGTFYDAYVAVRCPNGLDTSDYSVKVSFTTLCAPAIVVPFIENFTGLAPGVEGAIPSVDLANCWSIGANTNGFNWQTEDAEGVSENSLSTGPFYDHTSFGSAGGMYVYLETSTGYGSAGVAELSSPLIVTTTMVEPNLSFWYHMYGATIDTLSVDIYDQATSTWHNQVWMLVGEQQTAGADPWLEANVPLSAYGDTVQIRFTGSVGSSWTGDMALDDISVIDITTCPRPDQIVVDNVNHESVTLSWVNGHPNASQWFIEYGSIGFTPGTGTLVPVYSNPATISGLAIQTDYEAYVTELCQSGLDTSDTYYHVNFSTTCQQYVQAPYFEDFSGVAPGIVGGNGNINGTGPVVLDNCWSLISLSTNQFATANEISTWQTEDSEGNNENSASTGPFYDHSSFGVAGGMYLYSEQSIISNSSTLSAGIAGTPIIITSNLNNPSLSFWYHMYGSSTGTLRVDIHSFDQDTVYTDVWSISGQQQTSGSDPWLENIIPLDIYGDSIQIAFWAIRPDNSSKSDIAIDDISVTGTTPPAACFSIDSISQVNINRGLYRAHFDSIPGTNHKVEYKTTSETTWRSKSIVRADLGIQNFNITPSFNDSIQVRLAFEVGGVWNYGCETILEVPCKNQILNMVEQRSARCTSDSVLVRAGYAGGYSAPSFLWSNGATTKRTYADQGEKLFVTVTDAAGCSISDSITASSLDGTAIPENFGISKNNPTTFTGNWTAPALPNGATLIGYRMAYRLRNTLTYIKLPTTTNLSATVDFTGSGLPAGNYDFVVFTRYRDANQVARNSNFTCVVAKGYNGVGNKNNFSTDGSSSALYAIYPNPAHTEVFIAAPGGSNVQLMDMNGKIITNQKVQNAEVSFDLTNLANGVYMVRIITDQEVFVDRIIKD